VIKDSFILKINTNNLLQNYSFFKQNDKSLIVAPTIKANGYGLGDKKLFKLFKKNKVKHFFVATLKEGINLDNKDKSIKIYVLNGIQNYDVKIFIKNNLIPIINSVSELKIINKYKSKFGLHIDTGINRLGIDYKNVPNNVYKNKNIQIVLSHLASADDNKNNYNEIQKLRFERIREKFQNKNIIFSLSNSNGVALSKNYLFDMIRPGIGLYGGNHKSKYLKKNLKNVIDVKGKIIQIKELNKSEFIGYNQTYLTKRKTKIAIIGVGYADGIPRLLSNYGKVYYKENIFNIIGRISMDSFTIDITKSKHNLKEGMFIDIINKKYDIEKFATQCKTISNEFLTSIGPRVKRIYE